MVWRCFEHALTLTMQYTSINNLPAIILVTTALQSAFKNIIIVEMGNILSSCMYDLRKISLYYSGHSTVWYDLTAEELWNDWDKPLVYLVDVFLKLLSVSLLFLGLNRPQFWKKCLLSQRESLQSWLSWRRRRAQATCLTSTMHGGMSTAAPSTARTLKTQKR